MKLSLAPSLVVVLLNCALSSADPARLLGRPGARLPSDAPANAEPPDVCAPGSPRCQHPPALPCGQRLRPLAVSLRSAPSTSSLRSALSKAMSATIRLSRTFFFSSSLSRLTTRTAGGSPCAITDDWEGATLPGHSIGAVSVPSGEFRVPSRTREGISGGSTT